MTLTNIEGRDTVMNAYFELLKTLNNAYISYEIRTPETDDDTDYQRKLFRTNADLSKLLKGIRGNYIISLMVDELFKSFDFDVKLPIKAVSFFKISKSINN
jgi:hypothetical protein